MAASSGTNYALKSTVTDVSLADVQTCNSADIHHLLLQTALDANLGEITNRMLSTDDHYAMLATEFPSNRVSLWALDIS